MASGAASATGEVRTGRTACRTRTTGPARSAGAEQPGVPACATGSAVAAFGEPAVTTRAATAVQPAAMATMATGSTGTETGGGSSEAAVATGTEQPAPVASGAPGRTAAAGATGAAVADQPGVPAGTPGHPGVCARRTATAVAVQQSPSPAALPGCRPIGAVADQRTSQ